MKKIEKQEKKNSLAFFAYSLLVAVNEKEIFNMNNNHIEYIQNLRTEYTYNATHVKAGCKIQFKVKIIPVTSKIM